MSGAEIIVHRKLVRDLIPLIVVANGEALSVRELGPEEYREALHAKLAEESAELRGAKAGDQLGELADILEVLKALAADAGLTLDEVTEAAAAKEASRGGFSGRLWLEWTQG